MYILLFFFQIAVSDVSVLVGLENETKYIGPLQLKDNSNIQNYLDNEYQVWSLKLKGLHRMKIRDFKENEMSYYEIWILQYYQQMHRIHKINPYLNYKQDLILEISDSDFLCLDFYLVKQLLILDCQHQLQQKIIFFQLNLETNQTSQQIFNYNYSISAVRKIYFNEQFIVILIKEVDNHIVSIFNRLILMEIKIFNNKDFKLPDLKVKKIIIKNDKMLILTLCQRLFVVDLFEPFLIQQICQDGQIQDIQENFDQGYFVFEQQNTFLLNDYSLLCVDTPEYQKMSRFRLFEQSGQFKLNPKNQQIEKLNSCNKDGVLYFSYIEQMIFCRVTNQIKQIILTDLKFSKVIITNNFYQTSDQILITRIVSPGQIEYIDIQEDFIPLLYVQSEQNIVVKYNTPFHGPNITYTIRSKEFIQIYNQLIIEHDQQLQCYFYDFYRISEQYKNYAYLCQFENKTVLISAMKIDFASQNKLIIFKYQLVFYLNENFSILSADSQKLRLMQLDNQQIYEFNQQNQQSNNTSVTAIYYNSLYFILNDNILQFRSLIESGIQFTFKLDNIKSLEINQKVNLIYLSTDKQYLFLGTENYVIVFFIATVFQEKVKFQVVQIFENQLEIKQIYLSHEILYLIYPDNDYLKILKYQKMQIFHFSYVGVVDCLGYKIEKFELNRNQAEDHYFINSYQDVLIFQLSKSLQDSLVRVMPNSIFIGSLDHHFCTSQKTKIICYRILEDRSLLQLNFDIIKHSTSISYEVCASNSISTRCISQNLRVVINYQALKINQYYLTQFNQDIYQINFDIQQGFIYSIKGNDNIEIIQPMKLIINLTSNIIQISEYENYLMMNSNNEIKFYHKQSKQFYQLNGICFQAFLIQNHLLCYQQSYSFLNVYNCEDIQNCIKLHQISINNKVLLQLKNSGNLILLKQYQYLEIVYYNPDNGKFMRSITLFYRTQNEVIQQINGYDFWFIYLNKENLYILKYDNFELYLNQTINIYEQFNKDRQFASKQDIIIQILVLEYNNYSITLLFLMKKITHKSYKFSLVNGVLDIQCIFELLFYRQQDSQEKYRYSLNNELLLIQIDQERLGVYNVSLNQKVFLRNILFVLQPTFIISNSLMRNIYHFIDQNEIFLFISQNSKLYLFKLNLNYQIRILDANKQSIINLNEEKENIQIILSSISDKDQHQNHQIAIAIAFVLAILYILRRQYLRRKK